MQGDLQLKSKGSLLAEFLLVQGTSVFGLLRPSTDWTRPTHIMVGNLISTKTTGLNVNQYIRKQRHYFAHKGPSYPLEKDTATHASTSRL